TVTAQAPVCDRLRVGDLWYTRAGRPGIDSRSARCGSLADPPLAFGVCRRDGHGHGPRRRLGTVNPPTTIRREPTIKPGPISATKPVATRRGEPSIVVRVDGENDIPAESLRAAMEIAMGTRGHVELRNREPLRLASGETFDFTTGQGPLKIRAAPGT